MKINVAVLTLLTCLTGCSYFPHETLPITAPVSQGAASANHKAAISRASALIQSHRQNTNLPSFSVAVVVNNELVWSEAVGWADVEHRIPATPLTTYRIGSTSKAITVTATAKLVDQEVVDLDTPISAYHAAYPEHWQPLTLRQLHSHTSGIPGYENNKDYGGLLSSYFLWQHYSDVDDALSQFDGSKLLFEPGTDYYYSSFDVVLASSVLQAVSSMPFLSVLDSLVFKDANMHSTGAGDTPNQATYYNRKARRVTPWRRVDLSNKIAAGGLVSTPTDLVSLGKHWFKADFIRPKTRELFWTPQRLSSGKMNPDNYAIGWRSANINSNWYGGELHIIHHGGVSKGAMAWLVIYPDLDMVIAFATNARADSFADFARPSSRLAEIFYRSGK